VVARRQDALRAKVLCVDYHLLGKESLESALFEGYLAEVRTRHPEARPPVLHRSEELFADAVAMRARIGDDAFFDALNGTGGEASGWGDLTGSWDAASFTTAVAAPVGDGERDRLAQDLTSTMFTGYLRAGEWLGISDGLRAMTEHARDLGYDGLVLFLDELVLWLAQHLSDTHFIQNETSKVAKLVETELGHLPIPLVSFVARQRDLTELVGDTITGAEQLRFSDALKHWEGRFHKITLEDRNLPEIASRRVLRPRSDEARRTLKESFDKVLGLREEVLAPLLTEHATEEMFR